MGRERVMLVRNMNKNQVVIGETSRRAFLLGAAAATWLDAARGAVRLHIGNYGLQSLAVDEALVRIREIGYDGAELCLMAGWPSEPGKLDAAARRRIREQPLPVPTLIENFNLLVSEAEHARTLERIGAAAALARDITPAKRPLPILQTVLGGKPDEWERVKAQMAARLADWTRAAGRSGIRLAVKSHIGSASNTLEKLIWLLDQVKGGATLSAIYDYGHFQLMGLGLTATLDTLLPRTSFLTVKDGHMVNGSPRFLLPGDGTIDYGEYFAYLKRRRYKGWMLVEISRQLQTQPGYDGVAAARRSYDYLAGRLRSAGLRQ